MSSKPYDKLPWWCQLLWPWFGPPWYEQVEDLEVLPGRVLVRAAPVSRQAEESIQHEWLIHTRPRGQWARERALELSRQPEP